MENQAKHLYFKANGKLLITSEYYVLDGAKALAMPSKYHQTMKIIPTETEGIEWLSYDDKNNIWFQCKMSKDIDLIMFSDESIAKILINIIKEALSITKNIDFNNVRIETRINFDRNFGLGTSSTLISLIAQWLQINPYNLLEKSFGGSGYDIACATNNQAILYRIKNGMRTVNQTTFNPNFKKNIYFVYLGKKQNSRAGIEYYKSINQKNKEATIKQLDSITEKLLVCDNIHEFNILIEEHENIISKNLQLSKVKELYFPDFNGSIKSLGAWGGDFIMATSAESESYVLHYFSSKKYNNIIPFNTMFQD